MSGAIFPSLPGLSWNVSQTPKFSTKIQSAVSGNETRAAFMQFPLWTFSMQYELLRGGATGDLEKLAGFFLAHRGSFDSFLYLADDCTADNTRFGTGGGGVRDFQLIRRRGAGGFTFAEPCQNIASVAQVTVNGVAVSGYSVSDTGILTLAAAPDAGAALAWSGSYYYRCRFLQDDAEFNQFLFNLWELRKLEFIGSPINKV